jgi:hypothetical protein
MASQAQRMPSLENSFRNLILNQRAAAEERFIRIADWDTYGLVQKFEGAASGRARSRRNERHVGVRDLTKTAVASAVVPYYWLPDDAQERSIEDRHMMWVRDVTCQRQHRHQSNYRSQITEVNGCKLSRRSLRPWKFHELGEGRRISCRIHFKHIVRAIGIEINR